MGLVLIAFVIAGFVPPSLSRPGGVASMPFLLHIHGAVFFAWFVLYCVQARLVGSGNIQLHMRLGQTSVLLAVAMIILAYFVMRSAYSNPEFSIAGMSRSSSIIFPFTDIVNFMIVYSLALVNRRNAAVHKRFMLLAGILIMDPAVARLVITLGAPGPLIVLLEASLFIALITYDLMTRRRPSWATMLGLGLFVLALVAKFTIAQQQGWHAFTEAAFG